MHIYNSCVECLTSQVFGYSSVLLTSSPFFKHITNCMYCKDGLGFKIKFMIAVIAQAPSQKCFWNVWNRCNFTIKMKMRREKLFQLSCWCQVMEETTSGQLLGKDAGNSVPTDFVKLPLPVLYMQHAHMHSICSTNAINSTWLNLHVYANETY